jgi:ATP-binding cassette subfamily C (CFTR/MRP) protein 1
MSVLAVVVVIAAGAPYVLLAFIPLGFLYRIVMRLVVQAASRLLTA